MELSEFLLVTSRTVLSSCFMRGVCNNEAFSMADLKATRCAVDASGVTSITATPTWLGTPLEGELGAGRGLKSLFRHW